MNIEKCIEVVDRYKALISATNLKPKRIDVNIKPASNKEIIEHVCYMLTEMDTMIDKKTIVPNSIIKKYNISMDNKFHRWLGFVQGVLFALNFFTLNQLRNHNKG